MANTRSSYPIIILGLLQFNIEARQLMLCGKLMVENEDGYNSAPILSRTFIKRHHFKIIVGYLECVH